MKMRMVFLSDVPADLNTAEHTGHGKYLVVASLGEKIVLFKRFGDGTWMNHSDIHYQAVEQGVVGYVKDDPVIGGGIWEFTDSLVLIRGKSVDYGYEGDELRNQIGAQLCELGFYNIEVEYPRR